MADMSVAGATLHLTLIKCRFGDPALARNVRCVTLRGRRRFLSWVHIRLIGNAAAVAAGGDEAKAAETERNR